jgi:hypothetical protein
VLLSPKRDEISADKVKKAAEQFRLVKDFGPGLAGIGL